MVPKEKCRLALLTEVIQTMRALPIFFEIKESPRKIELVHALRRSLKKDFVKLSLSTLFKVRLLKHVGKDLVLSLESSIDLLIYVMSSATHYLIVDVIDSLTIAGSGIRGLYCDQKLSEPFRGLIQSVGLAVLHVKSNFPLKCYFRFRKRDPCEIDRSHYVVKEHFVCC